VHTVRLPDLGEGLAEAEVVAWLVRVGDSVEEDHPLVEVETAKAVTQIPSPVAGTVEQLVAAEGARVPVGAPLVQIAVEAGAARQAPRALPSVRALAAELGVDLAALARGAEPVTEADVRAAAAEEAGSPSRRGVPLRGVRRQIAERMTAAAAIPTVTVAEECDFSALAAAPTPYARAAAIVRATTGSLGVHPELNATLESGEVLVHERCDLGYAVQGAHGLVVPVIRHAAALEATELAGQLERVVRSARAGTLTPADMRGGTFTITDAQRLGGMLATPLLNAPQVAILGVHRVGPRPVVRDGEIVARPVGLLSVTFDHRALDGAQAAGFLLEVIGRLESADAGEGLWAPA
jgi:pyruvate/2-oxoglutarate dehydrogenase complex dihydrolipoamide acyltransferase (E2) component